MCHLGTCLARVEPMELQKVEHSRVSGAKNRLPALYVKPYIQSELNLKLKQAGSVSQTAVDTGATSFNAIFRNSISSEMIELGGCRLYCVPSTYLRAICIEAYNWAQCLIQKNPSLGIDLEV